MANRTRCLFRVLFVIYVTTTLAYNPGTSWRNQYAFAALKGDGTVKAWGIEGYHNGDGGIISDSVSNELYGVKAIYSTETAFAALKEDGTVVMWGSLGSGESGVPVGLSGVKTVFA